MTTPEIPTIPGTPVEGGFYAGRIRVGADLFALIVAPKAEGESTGAWGQKAKGVPGAASYFDGRANTLAMAEAGSKIAQWALHLAIGGHGDWYIPSRDELELLYRHFKPTAETNYTWRSGDNPSSVPAGYPYTAHLPWQTDVTVFREGGEALDDVWYWASTQSSPYLAWVQGFDVGLQSRSGKSFEGRVRAVRRFLIT